MASLLLKKYPTAKISILVSSSNEFFETTKLFEQVKILNVESFFKATKPLKNEQIEEEMKKVLGSIIDTEWDQVINLSANLLGSIFTCLLRAKSFLGPYAQEDVPDVSFSNLASYMLANVPDEKNNYFHFAYLYKDIIGVYYDLPILSVWEDRLAQEADQLFKNLLVEKNKKKVILIDVTMSLGGKIKDIHFFANLYSKLIADQLFLPVFYTTSIDLSKDIIEDLQASIEGDVHFIACNNKTQLSLVNNASLIITDNLYMKTLADLSQVQTILIGRENELPLSDYSILEKSHLVFFKDQNNNLADIICSIVGRVFRGTALSQTSFYDVEIYSTKIHESLPILVPLNLLGDQDPASDGFSKWWLNLKFLAKIKKIELPDLAINKNKYLAAIKKERQYIWEIGSEFKKRFDQGESVKGILGIESEYMRFSNKKLSSDPEVLSKEMKEIQVKVLDFLSFEESRL